MKVLHVGESVLGGAGTYLNELLPLQQRVFGTENVVVLIPAEHLRQVRDPDPKSILSFRRHNRMVGLFHLALTFIVVMRSFRPDLVHAHSTFAGVVARLLCPLFGAPVVYCPHGWATEMEQSPARKRLVAWVERNLSHLCKRIVAVCEHERQRGIALGISDEKIVTVYNGISAEPPPFTPVPWADSRLKVLFVGRLDRQKGIDVLLEAIATLREKVCVRVIGTSVAGKADINFSAYPQIETFGWQSLAEVAAHMAACDVVVMPSRWEGLPIVALEAMRLSKPLIAASLGGIPEVVVEGQTGHLFSSGDAAALRRLLLAANREELRQMGLEGRNRFLSLFTVDRMCAGVLEMYSAIDEVKQAR